MYYTQILFYQFGPLKKTDLFWSSNNLISTRMPLSFVLVPKLLNHSLTNIYPPSFSTSSNIGSNLTLVTKVSFVISFLQLCIIFTDLEAGASNEHSVTELRKEKQCDWEPSSTIKQTLSIHY